MAVYNTCTAKLLLQPYIRLFLLTFYSEAFWIQGIFESETFFDNSNPSHFLVPKHFSILGIFESEVFLSPSNFESKFFITAQEMPCPGTYQFLVIWLFSSLLKRIFSKRIFPKQNIITNPAWTGSVVLLV